MPSFSRRALPSLTLAILLASAYVATAPSAHAAGAKAGFKNADRYAGWIAEMKRAPKGPFKRIRWFCHDGTVHPPKPYPCTERGGGIQHGQWNDRVVAMRGDGYYVGNVIADLEPGDFVGADADLDQLTQILVERFLRY